MLTDPASDPAVLQPQPRVRTGSAATRPQPEHTEARRPEARSRDERGRWLVPAIMAVVGLWIFSFAYAYAPVIPLQDGWTWIAHAKGYEEGGLRGLWREHPLIHTQHLYALPSSIALLAGPWVDYSFRPFAFLCVAVLLACGASFYRLARRHTLGRWEALAVFLAAASFRHYENLLDGFQIGLLLCVLLGSWAVLVADARRDRRGLMLAAVLAAGSAASSSAGLLTLVAVACVRWLDPQRPRRWLVVGLAAPLVLAAAHLALMALFGQSFVAQALDQITWSTSPRIFVDAVKLLGGGLVGGVGATPVGLALLAGAWLFFVAQVRRTRRFDALCGLTLLSLLMTLAVAVARSPHGEPSSRYAIFAAPAVGAIGIGLLRALGTSVVPQAVSSAALAVGLAWLHADARVDAGIFQASMAPLDQRLYLASIAGNGRLAPEEIALLNRGPTDVIRGLTEFARDQRLTIFSPRYHGMEVDNELPTQAKGAARRVLDEEGVLQLSGRGYLFTPYPCRFESGCEAQLTVEAAVHGKAAIGFVVRGADGAEKEGFEAPLAPGTDFALHSVRAQAAAGETLFAYVLASRPDAVVRIRSFSTVLVQRSEIP